jgi:hypothetical protein
MAAILRTSCARTGRALTLDLDRDGNAAVREKDASPLLFEPQIDWETFQKPNILDDF